MKKLYGKSPLSQIGPLKHNKSASEDSSMSKYHNIVLLGAAGFIGTNLTFALAADKSNRITVVSTDLSHCRSIEDKGLENVKCIESPLSSETSFAELTADQDAVYHLISTNVPTTSNQHISQELMSNVLLSSNLFDACAKNGVKKVVFFSSGGAVYGKESKCPLNENTPTNPITSYGIQKITIEKLLYLYNYMYGLDYRIIRLSNPYGPYQRPNGVLGAVTTFTYKALKHEPIEVYGDGSVVRDFIYIDDAIRGISNIVNGEEKHKTYNLGSGKGTSITEILTTISSSLSVKLDVRYTPGRRVDIPVNYLDISRYESSYGNLNPINLDEGIKKTAEFMVEQKMV